MRKTAKKKNKKNRPIQKRIPWLTLWRLYGKIILIVFFALAFLWLGWNIGKRIVLNRYPKVYASWWKDTLRLEQDYREGKTDLNHAQQWLASSGRLLSMQKPMKCYFTGTAPEDPFSILAEFVVEYKRKPDRIPSQVDKIIILHNKMTDFHQYIGFTKPVFLADRLVQEWKHLQQLIRDNAEGDRIQASIQWINLQIPLLEPYWLESDITNLKALGNTIETLWIHQQVEDILQLLTSSDNFLVRACLDPSY